MYEYKCKILRIVDGDTVDVDIDLGLSMDAQRTCKNDGIDTPIRNETMKKEIWIQ